jgi:uncharacterized protein (DUF58 family)
VKRPGVRVSVHMTQGKPAAGTLLVLVPLLMLLVLALAALMLVFLVVLALAAVLAVLLILGTKGDRRALRELLPSHRNLYRRSGFFAFRVAYMNAAAPTRSTAARSEGRNRDVSQDRGFTTSTWTFAVGWL